AKEFFTRLGSKCLMISDTPDGTNINNNCGSTHPEELMKFVRDAKLDLGLAFDGDADRMLAVDENGILVDGDKVIAICAKRMKDEGRLAKDTAVVTVMSNMGFFKFCEENSINCAKTAVGDRYVLEKMLKDGYNIGGEQSGHVIFLDYATTGDGELSGVQLLETVVKSGKKLSELASIMNVYPQVLINVKVSPEGKQKYNNDEYIIAATQKAEMELMGDGRVLVRVSGTEPLVRVMLEGKDIDHITKLGNEIAAVVKERLS
ncbi:MAG: phosphoglucosamine mutase, partial [Eubacterium sp.]